MGIVPAKFFRSLYLPHTGLCAIELTIMGFLPGLQRKKVSLVDNAPAAIITTNEQDTEKATIDNAETMRTTNVYYVDPTIERRVVRKLDWRLIPLLMGLCM